MQNEYEEWNKIKFKVLADKSSFIIRSVDFPAIPIAIRFPKSMSLHLAKHEVLKQLNIYNDKPRWTIETAGDITQLKKHKLKNGKIMYSFKPNKMEDLDFNEGYK